MRTHTHTHPHTQMLLCLQWTSMWGKISHNRDHIISELLFVWLLKALTWDIDSHTPFVLFLLAAVAAVHGNASGKRE